MPDQPDRPRRPADDEPEPPTTGSGSGHDDEPPVPEIQFPLNLWAF